jgi:hypothetical protein
VSIACVGDLNRDIGNYVDDALLQLHLVGAAAVVVAVVEAGVGRPAQQQQPVDLKGPLNTIGKI